MNRFEYTPKWSMDDLLNAYYTSADINGLLPVPMSRSCLRKKMQRYGIEPDVTGSKKLFSKETAIKFLNLPCFDYNWNIQGYIPLEKAAAQTGVRNGTMHNMLMLLNIPVKKQQIGRFSVWIAKGDVAKVQKHYAQSQRKTVESQDEEMLRLRYIAEKLGHTSQQIRALCCKNGIKPCRVYKGNVWFYRQSDFEKIAELVRVDDSRKQQKEKTEKTEWLAEMKAKHPLVKNERFFDDWYFPADELPVCLANLE